MSRIDNPPKQQNTVHLHYHHHYYHPKHQQAARQGKMRMSKSQFLPNNSFYEPAENKGHEQSSPCQPQNRSRDNSFKKLRISNCWSQQNSDSKHESKQKQLQLNSFASYTVLEEHASIDEDVDYTRGKEQTVLNYSMGTGTSQRFQLQKLLAQYKQELRRYKKQVQRLKGVEQECIYLRKHCLGHYQNCK